jgi:uncharacterized protein YndB with AHSA1/START domain
VPAPFRFDRRFEFAASPAELWSIVQETHRYPDWWSWLRSFDSTGLEPGSVSRCVIRAPLPYSLEITVEVEDVVPEERVQARVHGDLSGPASFELEANGSSGSSARLRWELELRDRVLRPMAKVARPAMVWAHDRVIEIGLREFERRALDGRRR